MDDEERSARGNEVSEGRNGSRTQSARSASATSASVPIIVTTPDSRIECAGSCDRPRPARVGVQTVDELPRIVADQLDQAETRSDCPM